MSDKPEEKTVKESVSALPVSPIPSPEELARLKKLAYFRAIMLLELLVHRN